MTQEDAENLLREAGQAADESFPLFDAAVACAVHEDPARDPRPALDLSIAWRNRQVGKGLAWFLEALADPASIAALLRGI